MRAPELPKDLSEVFEIAIFKRTESGGFKPLFEMPYWFRTFYPDLSQEEEVKRLSRYVPFLANFLKDAEKFWQKKKKGRLKSREWMESDPKGRKWFVTAVAFNFGDESYLMFEAGQCSQLELEVRKTDTPTAVNEKSDDKELLECKRLLEIIKVENDLLRQVITEYEQQYRGKEEAGKKS